MTMMERKDLEKNYLTYLLLTFLLATSFKSCFFQFEDPYRKPPKFWRFCDFPTIANSDVSDHDGSIVLQSYLNVFRVTQVTRDVATSKRLRFRVKALAVQDEDLALKVRT